MVYLGIGLVLLLLIAPIIALLPSARQREQAAMRQVARANGIITELVTIDDPDPDPGQYVSSLGKPLAPELKVIAYRKARQRPEQWRDLPKLSWCLIRTRERAEGLPPGWAWRASVPDSKDLSEKLIQQLTLLPDDVVMVDEQGYRVSVYWRENGGDGALEQVIGYLDAVAQLSVPDAMSDSAGSSADDDTL